MDLRTQYEEGMIRVTTDTEILQTISNADPDGDESRRTAPTAVDYDRHERWAREQFGDKAWEDYQHGAWTPSRYAAGWE